MLLLLLSLFEKHNITLDDIDIDLLFKQLEEDEKISLEENLKVQLLIQNNISKQNEEDEKFKELNRYNS